MRSNKLKTSLAGMALLAAIGASAQTAPSYSAIELPCSNKLFHGNFVWMDHNMDGKMDMAVKGRDLNDNWTIKAALLRNRGNDFESEDLSAKIELNETWDKVLAPIDYNNDGYVDLLYAGYGEAKLYKNTKGNSFKVVSNFQIEDMDNEEEALYTGFIAVADYDNDGYQDIATFDKERRIVLYHNNNGDGTFSKADNALDGESFPTLGSGSLAWGDYDNDGRPDLIATGWGNDATYSVLYHNLGNGKFEKIAIDQSEGGIVSGTQKGQITWVDINGDGCQDLFYSGETYIGGNWDKSCAIYLNTGDTAVPFRKMEADLPKVQKSGVDWADVNGDGKMDLVYAGNGDNDASMTIFVLNKDNNTFDIKTDVVMGFRSGAVVGLYDYDNDGFVDMAAMGYNDPATFGIYHNGGNTAKNTAPTSPTGLKATAGDNNVTFSWSAGSDTQTPVSALRYNLVIKLKNDQIISLVPANLSTGALSLGDCNNALTSLSYTLNIPAADIEEWGVQTIDQGKLGSTFATSKEIGTGIGQLEADKDNLIKITDGKIYLQSDEAAIITVYNSVGQAIATETVQPGNYMNSVFNRNIYIVQVRTANYQETIKVTIE